MDKLNLETDIGKKIYDKIEMEQVQPYDYLFKSHYESGLVKLSKVFLFYNNNKYIKVLKVEAEIDSLVYNTDFLYEEINTDALVDFLLFEFGYDDELREDIGLTIDEAVERILEDYCHIITRHTS